MKLSGIRGLAIAVVALAGMIAPASAEWLPFNEPGYEGLFVKNAAGTYELGFTCDTLGTFTAYMLYNSTETTAPDIPKIAAKFPDGKTFSSPTYVNLFTDNQVEMVIVSFDDTQTRLNMLLKQMARADPDIQVGLLWADKKVTGAKFDAKGSSKAIADFRKRCRNVK
jgi:hypothetical protein